MTSSATLDDAFHLAGLLLEDDRSGVTRRLFSDAGWPHLRFNAAFALLMPCFQWTSGRLQAEFPTAQFKIDPVRLALFRDRHERSQHVV